MTSSAEIIEHAYRHPVHRGETSGFQHVAESENPMCGDAISVGLRLLEGRIQDARFEGRGCAISQASTELLLDRLIGSPVTDVELLGREEVLRELGLPDISPARLRCALLPLEAIRKALR